MTDSPEPIEEWGSAPGRRAPLIVGATISVREAFELADATFLNAFNSQQTEAQAEALQSLITATGSHVTLGTPCVAADEIPVTDEMRKAGGGVLAFVTTPDALGGVSEFFGFAERIYRAMAPVAPVELYGPSERRLEDENASLKLAAQTEVKRAQVFAQEEVDRARQCVAMKNLRLAALEADNAALVAAQDAAIARITELEAELVFAGTLGAENAALEAENAALVRTIDVRQAQIDALHSSIDLKDARIAALEAELVERDANDARLLAVTEQTNAKLIELRDKLAAAFGPVTPADLPDPPRRADGTLAPVARPWTPPKAAGDTRRVGS